MFDLDEIEQFELWHPRAVKLFGKRKNFVVVAEDEPYFMRVYGMIRDCEKEKGTWTEEDEQAYQSARHRVQSDEPTVGLSGKEAKQSLRDLLKGTSE